MTSNFLLLKKNYIISLVVMFYIFFWDLFATLGIKFDIRIVIFLISPYLFLEILKDLNQRRFKFIIISILIFSFLILHSYFVGNLMNLKFFFSVIFLIYLFGLSFYFHKIILENKILIIKSFIFLYFFSILIHFFLEIPSNPEPFSCGAIKNIIGGKNNFESPLFYIHFISSYDLIFNENSHLAMSITPIIFLGTYLAVNKKENILFKISIFLFVVICLLKSSATLLAGLVASILCILVFEYKRLGKNFIIFLFIFTSILVFNFLQDGVCRSKVIPNANISDQINKFNPLSKQNKIKNELNKENISINEKDFYLEELKKIEKQQIKNLSHSTTSLSSDVFYHALKITLNSILTKPFGWGFQGYELAFNEFNKKNNLVRNVLKSYNSKDASNTLFKTINEFGFLSVIIYLSILFFLLNKNILIENKIFITTFLITQSLRGAGYFNAGYLLILFLMLVIQFQKQKDGYRNN